VGWSWVDFSWVQAGVEPIEYMLHRRYPVTSAPVSGLAAGAGDPNYGREQGGHGDLVTVRNPEQR